MCPFLRRGHLTYLVSGNLAKKLCFSFKRDGRARASSISGEGDVLSYPNDIIVSGQDKFVNQSPGVELQPDAIGFGTLSAEITPSTGGFFVDNDEYDLDRPTEGCASIPEAIEDIHQGKMVIVVDDEDRENEGDLVMAASKATPEAMAFFVKHGTGIVCVSMKAEDLERLELPLMVTHKENEEKLCTAFTVSVLRRKSQWDDMYVASEEVRKLDVVMVGQKVLFAKCAPLQLGGNGLDAKHGTSTGVSARDRATTIVALASKDSKPEDFNRPGHIFPLRYREGGVLKRAGHTEASVDLAMLAGLEPVAVLCEIVDDDGSMARLPRLRQFAQAENLKIISIADLIRYRRKRDRLVELAAAAPIPTMWGPFKAYCYRSLLDGIEHIAMVKGEIGGGKDILVRVHSECLTGDIFGSARCDCGNQLALAMKQIEEAGRGVLVYLRGHEGRGIGLGHKLRAYNLQDDGRDTVEANEELGLPVDSREYGIGAQMLRDLGVRTMKLMTNNPAKYVGLKGYGLAVAGRVPLLTPITMENKRYLETKREKMGHVYDSDSGPVNGLIGENDNSTTGSQSNGVSKA
ncbi:GTP CYCLOHYDROLASE II-RELATED [Salix viminalis]|nr:GTP CYCLOHYDROLASE II-RELATED [Salix viminalis]